MFLLPPQAKGCLHIQKEDALKKTPGLCEGSWEVSSTFATDLWTTSTRSTESQEERGHPVGSMCLWLASGPRGSPSWRLGDTEQGV